MLMLSVKKLDLGSIDASFLFSGVSKDRKLSYLVKMTNQDIWSFKLLATLGLQNIICSSLIVIIL